MRLSGRFRHANSIDVVVFSRKSEQSELQTSLTRTKFVKRHIKFAIKISQTMKKIKLKRYKICQIKSTSLKGSS